MHCVKTHSLRVHGFIGLAIAAMLGGTSASAHHPERECQPVTRRIEVIPPLGNRLPPEYRRRYNRPTEFGGRIAYWIAPSSQEAMAWHDAQHRGDYECDRGRVVPRYIYAKPWEAIVVGPRPDPSARAEREDIEDTLRDNPPELEPSPIDDLVEPSEGILDEVIDPGMDLEDRDELPSSRRQQELEERLEDLRYNDDDAATMEMDLGNYLPLINAAR